MGRFTELYTSIGRKIRGSMAFLSISLLVIGYSNDTTGATFTLSQCNRVASEVNKTLPIVVDEVSTVRSTICARIRGELVYIYNYEIDYQVNFSTSDIDGLRTPIVNQWCSNPVFEELFNGVDRIEYAYSLTTGKYIGKLTFSRGDC